MIPTLNAPIYELPSIEYREVFVSKGMMEVLNEDIIHSTILKIFNTLPRGFYVRGEVFINIDAFYLCELDKQLLIEHEIGHAQGKEHTFLGVMCPYGPLRLLSYLLGFR